MQVYHKLKKKLKKILKKILPTFVKNILKEIRYIVRAKRRVKPFLSPGIYRIRVMSLSKTRMTIVPKLLIKIRRPYRGLPPEAAAPGIKELICYFAGIKRVFFTGNRAISIYSSDKYIQQLEKYVGYIIYPMSEFLEISVQERYTVAKRIMGKPYFDREHALYLAGELLRFAGQATDMARPEKFEYLNSTDYQNIRYHVQHGDMQPYNVLWQDDTHYSMIDFDLAGVFPTFYDFFYIILSEEERGTVEYLNGYFDREIADYMKAFGINVPIELFKDECLAAFLSVPGKFISADRVARRCVPLSYRKTHTVLAANEKHGEARG